MTAWPFDTLTNFIRWRPDELAERRLGRTDFRPTRLASTKRLGPHRIHADVISDLSTTKGPNYRIYETWPDAFCGTRQITASRQFAVRRHVSAATCAGVPEATIRPPSSPAPGPMSMIQLLAAATVMSCSTTMTVNVYKTTCVISFATSEGCSPIVGSSST